MIVLTLLSIKILSFTITIPLFKLLDVLQYHLILVRNDLTADIEGFQGLGGIGGVMSPRTPMCILLLKLISLSHFALFTTTHQLYVFGEAHFA